MNIFACMPALKMSGSKMWWKPKTYEKFGSNTCKLTKKEIENIIFECEKALVETIADAIDFKEETPECNDFVDALIGSWKTSFFTDLAS